jgi:type I restriction enzyme S subunit
LTPLFVGDVVYSKVKAFEGAVTVVPPSGSGRFVSPEFPVFSVADSVDSHYLRHLLASEEFLNQLRGSSNGIGARRERVHPTAFLEIKVPLPDLPVQRRLAKHLDTTASVLRRVTGANETIKAALVGLIEDAICASRAVRAPLGELLVRDREWLEPAENQLYRPIGVRGFGRGIIHYAKTPQSELPKLRFYNLQPQRLLVSNIKAWEGAVAVTTEEDRGRIASNRFLQYRLTSHAASLEWINTYLLSRAGIKKLQDASPGSADRNRALSMDTFESIEVPIPSMERQGAVLRTVRKAASIKAAGERRLTLGNALLSATRNEVFSSLL